MRSPTAAQQGALDQLREVEGASGGAVEVLGATLRGTALDVEIAIDCRPYARIPEGLGLRDRERFVIALQPDVPFEGPPEVFVRHLRWCGWPHVNWCTYVCLYLSPSTEWNPSAGMFGLVERLDRWLQDAAMNRLNPEGAPLHPPSGFLTSSLRVIPRKDTPKGYGGAWRGLAVLEHVRGEMDNERVEILGWSLVGEVSNGRLVAPAILLDASLPHDLPRTFAELLHYVPERDRTGFIDTLRAGVLATSLKDPFVVIVGTPMRGIAGGDRRQHLIVWHVDQEGFRRLKGTVYARRRDGGEQTRLWEWATTAPIRWCPVHEMRPEIVTPRDAATPMEWFRGKRVAVWGCGALGAPLALLLARAGVASLVLRDSKVVTPGVLVRQPYEPDYIGVNKAVALGDLLEYAVPGLPVEAYDGNVVTESLALDDASDGADFVIDATANRAVLAKIEDARRAGALRVPIASASVDALAARGLVLYAAPDHSGGPYDLSRRVKLAVTASPALRHVAEAFFPEEPSSRLFQPEPGCSDPTFVGSAADANALAATLLNALAVQLAEAESTGQRAAAVAVTQPHVPVPTGQRRSLRICPAPDLVLADGFEGYEVRLSAPAWADTQAWIRHSARVRGPLDETGGLLFGQVDDVLRVVWVSEVSGPPPDSKHSRALFVCGTEGTAQMNAAKRARSRGSVGFVGMWHSHPVSSPTPSPTDNHGTDTLFRHTAPSPRQSLLLIVGYAMSDPVPAAYLYQRPAEVAYGTAQDTQAAADASPDPDLEQGAPSLNDVPPESDAAVGPTFLGDSAAPPADELTDRAIAVVLYGHGTRALPFHAGALRALRDHDLLDRVVLIGAEAGTISAALVAGLDLDTALDRMERLAAAGLPRTSKELKAVIADAMVGAPNNADARDGLIAVAVASGNPIRIARTGDPPEGFSDCAVAALLDAGPSQTSPTAALLDTPVAVRVNVRTVLSFGDGRPPSLPLLGADDPSPDWREPAHASALLDEDPPAAAEAPAGFVSAADVASVSPELFALEDAVVGRLALRGEHLARLLLPSVFSSE